VYDYIDFQKVIPDTVSFDPSVMLPKGANCAPVETVTCAHDSKSVNNPALASMTGPGTQHVEVDLDASTGCRGSDFVTRGAAGAAVAVTCALRSLARLQIARAMCRVRTACGAPPCSLPPHSHKCEVCCSE
jgi:hypothetical protein